MSHLITVITISNLANVIIFVYLEFKYSQGISFEAMTSLITITHMSIFRSIFNINESREFTRVKSSTEPASLNIRSIAAEDAGTLRKICAARRNSKKSAFFQ